MLVKLDRVSVTYSVRRGRLGERREDVVAVDDVSLEIRLGQTLGIVGRTGAGKSTVARLVMGMVTPTSGSVEVAGVQLTQAQGEDRRRLDRLRQVVLQDPFSSLNPRMTVRDIIAEPLTLGAKPVRRESRLRIQSRVAELLGLVGLPEERARDFPHQFSGGQRQRISIARALAPDPELIVLDEPTSALDVSVRAQILSLLRKLQRKLHLTYLVISHDLMTVAYLSSTVAVMYRGRVVEIGPTRQIFRAPRHPYTVRLLASAPSRDVNFLELPRLSEAQTTSLPVLESSCPYAPLCPLRSALDDPRSEMCDTLPVLRGVGPDHLAACHFSDEMDRIAVDTYRSASDT